MRFFLLSIQRNRRLLHSTILKYAPVYVFKLSVSIRMLRSLDSFPVCLQAAPAGFEQPRHLRVADSEAQSPQLRGNRSRAPACPPQGTHRISTGGRLDDRFQSAYQFWFSHLFRVPPSPGPLLTPRLDAIGSIKLLNSGANGTGRQTCCGSHGGYATPPYRSSFHCSPLAKSPLVEMRCNRDVLLSNPFNVSIV
ncbi:MAG: hypothetical protein RLZZ436_3623 [Planctomycetota bacterium]|jgi:hypothetical protein